MGLWQRSQRKSFALRRMYAEGILGFAGIPLFISLIARQDVILREQRPAFLLAWAALFFVAFIMTVLLARCVRLALLAARWSKIKAARGASGSIPLIELSAELKKPYDALVAGLYALIDFGVLPSDAIDVKRGQVIWDQSKDLAMDVEEEPGTELAEHRSASTTPIYLTGLAFCVYCFLFPVFAPMPAVVGLVLSGLVFSACWKLFPGRVVLRKVPDTEEPLESMGAEDFFKLYDRRVSALNAAAGQIQNAQLREQVGDLGPIALELGTFLRGQPEDIPKIRQFMKYYLPMTTKMLCDYRAMEGYGEKGASVLSAMRQIEEILPTVRLAFQQELETFQAGAAGDISVEVQVLRKLLMSTGRGVAFRFGADEHAVKAGGDAQ